MDLDLRHGEAVMTTPSVCMRGGRCLTGRPSARITREEVCDCEFVDCTQSGTPALETDSAGVTV